MKKSFLLLLIFIIFGAGTVCYAQNTLLEEKDKVNFKETVVYGDKSVVEGVTVTMKNWYENYLSWDSTYVIGETPKVDTDYNFYAWGLNDYHYAYSGSIGFVMDGNGMSNLEWQVMNEENTSEDAEGMERALWDLYYQVGPDEEKEITVKLKDYMDYYTFGVDFTGPLDTDTQTEQISLYLNKGELLADIVYGYQIGLDTSEIIKTEKYLGYLETFQEFFKIPVLENEIYEMAMKKDADGKVVGFGGAYCSGGFAEGNIAIPDYNLEEGGDSFHFSTPSIVDDGHCYLTFDTHTNNGNIVDTSQIPGGYGIYHFTYDEEKQEIYPEELEMVYALDPSIEIHSLFIDVCEKNLLLIAREDNRNTDYMYVIDKETMTLQEKFEVGNEKDGCINDFQIYEDYMVVKNGGIMVFTIDENGAYTLQFTAPTDVLDSLQVGVMEFDDIPSWNMTYDWNGEKLIFANSMYNENWQQEAGFYVGAIDESGLLYLGTYESSLRTPDVAGDGYSICGPMMENAISIFFSDVQ